MRFAFVSLLPALSLAGKASYTFTPESTALRAALMSGYDKHVPASSNRSALHNVDYSQAGTDIEMQLRFFKVESVRPSHGDMRLKIWMRCYWQDDRLRWDPAAYNGLEYTMFWVDPTPTGSSSEIWVPDIQPYNAIHGTVSTLEPCAPPRRPSSSPHP